MFQYTTHKYTCTPHAHHMHTHTPLTHHTHLYHTHTQHRHTHTPHTPHTHITHSYTVLTHTAHKYATHTPHAHTHTPALLVAHHPSSAFRGPGRFQEGSLLQCSSVLSRESKGTPALLATNSPGAVTLRRQLDKASESFSHDKQWLQSLNAPGARQPSHCLPPPSPGMAPGTPESLREVQAQHRPQDRLSLSLANGAAEQRPASQRGLATAKGRWESLRGAGGQRRPGASRVPHPASQHGDLVPKPGPMANFILPCLLVFVKRYTKPQKLNRAREHS